MDVGGCTQPAPAVYPWMAIAHGSALLTDRARQARPRNVTFERKIFECRCFSGISSSLSSSISTLLTTIGKKPAVKLSHLPLSRIQTISPLQGYPETPNHSRSHSHRRSVDSSQFPHSTTVHVFGLRRKAEYLERTHAGLGRTSHRHTENPLTPIGFSICVFFFIN